MAQKTSWTGAAASEADIVAYLMHEGGAWTSYTPTLVQSGAVTKAVNYANYGRAGRLIYGSVELTCTGSGTGANSVTIGLPVASQAGVTVNLVIGTGWLYDSSAATFYSGALILATSTTAVIIANATTGSLGVASFTAALAANDIVSMNFLYEAAS